MAKGKLLSVSGNIQTRNYEAKDGTRRYVTEVIADEVDFLEWSSKPGSDKSATKDTTNDLQPLEGEIPF